jgi:2-polyprenyl-3-methyl-5-hydroxy-6-metoxy-1,4-benzoquinol methylase/uncharacterized protein YbaR (Trm112 family)
MKSEMTQELVCPECAAGLTLIDEQPGEHEIKNGALICQSCSKEYLVRDYIPRFVPKANYASNFGLEWNIHARTQIDKFNGTTITRDRFFRETKWDIQAIKRQRILEAGSGAGRFSQVVLDAGAILYSFDLSEAVEANFKTNGQHENLNLVQASIYQIPFKEGSFDKIFCLGVLQHTPDPKKSFMSLIPYLAEGGEIVVDVYAKKNILTYFQARHILRPFTARMRSHALYNVVRASTPRLLSVADFLDRVPLIGRRFLVRFVPVSIPGKSVPEANRLEWAILNTFDAYSPRYDRPQTSKTLREWFDEAGLKAIEIFKDSGVGTYVGRGTKP